MLSADEKNIKDMHGSQNLTVRDDSAFISYSRHKELVMALFMVTDIMDNKEPVRLKLRKLGTDILSDIHTEPMSAKPRIALVLSFIDLSRAVNLISPMNADVLVREFQKLSQALDEYGKVKSMWLPDFLAGSSDLGHDNNSLSAGSDFQANNSLRTRRTPTRIGVQKGGSLMRALKDINLKVTNGKTFESTHSKGLDFDMLKKHRRLSIVQILKVNPNGLTITDIKAKASGQPERFDVLNNCGEKTLQRELIAMVHDGVLKKSGEKRWSRYILNPGSSF